MELTLEKAQEMMAEKKGNLDLSYDFKITQLPENLTVGGSLYLDGTGITKLPENLKVGRDLFISHTNITSLPKGLKVGGNLYFEGTGITQLPENLTVGGCLNLRDTGITQLSENLTVGGSLYLDGTGITKLPENLKVGRDLFISHTNITSLPEGLKVNGYLDISHTMITELPEGLKVNGSLDISCTMITKLPEGLKVNDYLDISNTRICEFRINELPENLQVGRKIIALPPTLLQTHEELGKWYTKQDKWETEIAKRQKQQLPHSEEKQATEKFSIDNDQITVKSIVTEKQSEGTVYKNLINTLCVTEKEIEVLQKEENVEAAKQENNCIYSNLKASATSSGENLHYKIISPEQLNYLKNTEIKFAFFPKDEKYNIAFLESDAKRVQLVAEQQTKKERKR